MNVIKLQHISKEVVDIIGNYPDDYWFIREDYTGDIPDTKTILIDNDQDILAIPCGTFCSDYFEHSKKFWQFRKTVSLNHKIIKPIIKNEQKIIIQPDLDIDHVTEYIEVDNPDIKLDFGYDATYIINMPNRTDRYEKCLKQIQYLSKSFYKVYPIKPKEKDWFHNTNVKSCFLSHHYCLKHAHLNGFKKILILEDDFIINTELFDDFEKLKNLVDKHIYDLLFFYNGYEKNPRQDISIINNERTWLSHFYIVNNIEKVLKCVEQDYRPGVNGIDQIYKYHPAIKVILTSKQYVVQDNGISDLWKTNIARAKVSGVDYNNLIIKPTNHS